MEEKAKKWALFVANNNLQLRGSINIYRNFQGFSDRSYVSAFEPIFISKLD